MKGHQPGGLVFLLFLYFATSYGQGSNPFELTPRLSEEAQQVLLDTSQSATMPSTNNGNPFELEPRLSPTDLSINPKPTTANPFELSPRNDNENSVAPSPTKYIRETAPKLEASSIDQQTSTWFFPALVGLLGLTAIFFILFRGLYQKAYRAMFNDNLMWQLYRERSSGNMGRFLLTYLLFLLSASCFIYVASQQLGYSLYLDYTYPWILGAVATLFVLKHTVLAFMGYVFPIDKETSQYSFSIMVAAILMGPILALASLSLAYVAPSLQQFVLYMTGGIVILIYIIRSLRGLFIANHFLGSHLFHFLLYLCAIEIIPLLWIYKITFRV